MNKATIFFIAIFSLLLLACTTSGHRIIDINPPPFGAQFVSGQLNTLLNNTGFEKIELSRRVTDPNAGANDSLNMKTGMVIQNTKSFFMRYQHQNYTALMIDVTIGKEKGGVKLEFYELNKKQLSAESMNIYQQFKDNLTSDLYNKHDFSES